MNFINELLLQIGTQQLGLHENSLIYPSVRFLLLITGVALIHAISTYLFTPTLRKIAIKTNLSLISYLIKHKFFLNIFRLAPLVLAQHFSYFIGSETIEAFLNKATSIALIASSSVLIFCTIDAVYDLLEHKRLTRNAPIKSIAQLLKVITVCVTLIMTIATFMDKSPTYLLSGLGALSAVLLIVFKDPLVNFFAGLQIASQKLVRIGDWVEIDGVVDGTVVSINMVNATIRGWSNQTHTVSLSKLLEGKNWRDMPNIGRHIKRSFYVDIDSVDFVEYEDIQRLSKFSLMKDYFEGKEKEQEEWGRAGLRDCKEPINQREMTNVGCFRYYIKNYLLHHPKINENGTILVRQLNPTEKGLPIQIYAFTKPEYAGWVETEELSSDIIDWVFAIAKRFDVKIYQQPSQYGLKEAIKENTSNGIVELFNDSTRQRVG